MGNNNNGKIFLNLYGTPTIKGSMCLNHGHGYYAYVSTKDTFIRTLFKDICMWGGPTDSHETIDGIFYSHYELDCRDKDFFKSDSFKKICHRHDVELIIFDNNDDPNIIRDFWGLMKRR